MTDEDTQKRKQVPTDENLLHGMTNEDIQQHLAKKTKYNKNKTTIIDGTENYGLDHVTQNNDVYRTGVAIGNSNYGFQNNSGIIMVVINSGTVINLNQKIN